MLSLAGARTFARGRIKHCGVEYDPRPGQLQPGIEPGSLGESARSRWLIGVRRIRDRAGTALRCLGEFQPRRLAGAQ